MKGYEQNQIWMRDSSLLINIPEAYVQSLNLQKGEPVSIKFDKKAMFIIIKPSK